MSAVPTDDNDEMDEQQLEAQHGKYRWTEYRDVSTAARVIEHAPQCSGKSPSSFQSHRRAGHDMYRSSVKKLLLRYVNEARWRLNGAWRDIDPARKSSK